MGRTESSNRVRALGAIFCAALAGCGVPVLEEPPAPPTRVAVPAPPPAAPTAQGDERAEVSWDTERDGRFARFLQENAGGMVRKAAVGIEKRGVLRVEVGRAVEPDDVLPLTRSLLDGARKDFPDRPITLSVFDPSGAPILRARFRPGQGVRYEIAHEGRGGDEPAPSAPAPPAGGGGANAIARGGVTERDQKFAAWAEEHGRALVRYVEADLERHGRLWFGITRDVAPADVKPLTKSLLEGARKEFPGRDLVATVFDPNGERIGRARLGRDGDVEWAQ